jgi:hypothetical protein
MGRRPGGPGEAPARGDSQTHQHTSGGWTESYAFSRLCDKRNVSLARARFQEQAKTNVGEQHRLTDKWAQRESKCRPLAWPSRCWPWSSAPRHAVLWASVRLEGQCLPPLCSLTAVAPQAMCNLSSLTCEPAGTGSSRVGEEAVLCHARGVGACKAMNAEVEGSTGAHCTAAPIRP